MKCQCSKHCKDIGYVNPEDNGGSPDKVYWCKECGATRIGYSENGKVHWVSNKWTIPNHTQDTIDMDEIKRCLTCKYVIYGHDTWPCEECQDNGLVDHSNWVKA